MINNRIYTVFVFLLLTGLLVSGCGQVGGVSATQVLTPNPPTDTPQPPATLTSTPEPSATATRLPTKSPTATPNVEATLFARVTEEAEDLEAALVVPFLEKYGVDPADGHLVYRSDKPVKLELTSYMERANWVIEDVGPLTDFVVQSKITWTTSGALSLCGITFHAEEDLDLGAQNQFFMMRLQFDPGWTIWRWEYGEFQYNLAGNWMSSADIHDKNDSTNLVALVVRGKDINVYLNGDKQRLVEDTKLKEGLLALSAHQESGKTTCTFEDTWVWAITP